MVVLTTENVRLENIRDFFAPYPLTAVMFASVLANFILCIDFQFLLCVCVWERARACMCVCVCVCTFVLNTPHNNNLATSCPSPLSNHVPLQPLFRPNSIKASRIIEWDIHVTMKVFSARFLGKSMTCVMIFFLS